MASQPAGERQSHGVGNRHSQGDCQRASGVPPPACHPSAADDRVGRAELVPARRGLTSITAADAPDAVRRLVALVRQLLGGEHERDRPLGASTELAWRLQRVTRLRDELHVTANRVARFRVEEHPSLDPAHPAAPITAGAVLAPEQVLYRLGLTAGRLVTLLEQLPAGDWSRTGRMGDRLMTLGELVERVLHTATHDVLDLLHAVPEGVAAFTHDGSRRERLDSPRPGSSPLRKLGRDATAS